MKGLPTRTVSPGWQLVILIGLLIAGFCLANLLALGLAAAMYHLSLSELTRIGTDFGRVPHSWAALMLLQGLGLAGAGAGALVLPLLIGQPIATYFAPRRLGSAWKPLAAGLLILVLVPMLSIITAWNAGAHFPAWAHGFEQWARTAEDQAQQLTSYLTAFNSAGRLLVGLVVIALVPAVAEELVFRGVVQRNLVRATGSRHMGVWLTAAIFSAIHFQFFGFVPRLLLGLVLGYLYEWSGNILVPMAAHFTQNALQLLLLYLAQGKHLPTVLNPDANQALPWPTVLLSALLSLGLLRLLHRQLPAGTIAQT